MPDVLSAPRAAGLNEQVVTQWFHQYEKLLKELSIEDNPSHGLWWNRSSRLVLLHTTAKKEEMTTCLAAFDAVGIYKRALVIINVKQLCCKWLSGCPKKMSVRLYKNRWIYADLFGGHMFLQALRKEDPQPHLLHLDGSSSHVKIQNSSTLWRARMSTSCATVPLHTTHALKPADKAFF